MGGLILMPVENARGASGVESLLLFEEFQKLPDSEDGDVFIFTQIEKLSVAADDDVCFCVYGS